MSEKIKNNAIKLAHRIWDNYEKLQYTFSHSLSAGRYKKDTVELAIKAMNNYEKKNKVSNLPKRENFVEEFVKVSLQKYVEKNNKKKLEQLDRLIVELLKDDSNDDEILAIIDKHTIVNSGRLQLFKGI